MEPEKKNDAGDKPPVLKEESIALAKAGDLPGALEAIATATAEPEKVPPASYVKRRRENANAGVGIGVLLQVIGFCALRSEDGVSTLGISLFLLSLLPFIWGCMNYGEAKGYPKEVGLLGLLGIIGLIVLMALPHKFQSLLPLPRERKIVGWISLILGFVLIVWGGSFSWAHSRAQSSPEQKAVYELAEAGYQYKLGTDNIEIERLSWYNRLLYREDAAGLMIFFGSCLIVASLVMLLYRRKKPQPENAHEGET